MFTIDPKHHTKQSFVAACIAGFIQYLDRRDYTAPVTRRRRKKRRPMLLGPLLAAVIIWYTGFHDYNDNGLREDNEPLIAGLYEMRHRYPGGWVEVTTVEQVQAGQWMFLTPRPEHSFTIVTLCAVFPDLDDSTPDETQLYVPLKCGWRGWLPLVQGGAE